ncbi:MAG: LrgB family protein [Clostridiales bacterium]|nr:LrgB family protein [Clostridiales bacterium]
MKEMIEQSVFFGVAVSIFGYEIGLILKKKLKLSLFNPLLVSIFVVIGMLLFLKVDYSVYYEGAKYLSYLLTPATVCLAVPLYEQTEALRKNGKAIMAGLIAGVLTSLGSILLLAYLFGLNHKQYVTLLPKSITTAIGMSVSEELGGMVTITVAVITITGVLGNMIAKTVCRLAKIEEPVAKGIAIGSASHAIGTVRAMEMGEVEGAMSSLAIAVAGLLTVAGASVFANFL